MVSESNDSNMGENSVAKTNMPSTNKGFTFEVVLLDGEHVNIEMDKNAQGQELFDKVCQHLDLIEKEYFGLQYVDERLPQHLKCWLCPEKKISKQKSRGPWIFDFALKFYPPDPTQLRESLTRWLVTLQVRRDILSGKLPTSLSTQAMMGSYCVQADIGDHDPSEHRGVEYIKDIPFATNQTVHLLEKIVELHRQHKGQTPDEAECNFLENGKKLAMYGVDLHAAQDIDDVDIMLGVCASGILVFRDKVRIGRFVWPRILKISYKRRLFFVKVRPSEFEKSESTFCFKLNSHRLAKRLWKICVEHHAFFRLRESEQALNSAMFPRLKSQFRYSGRTLYQARRTSQILERPDPYFERSQPARSIHATANARTKSVDDVFNRSDVIDDGDEINRRRHSESRDGRSRVSHIGQPTIFSQIGLPPEMRSVGDEDVFHTLNKDGKDRRDEKGVIVDSNIEKGKYTGESAFLTPAEVLKKAKEEDKVRKKQEKEDEKRQKRLEEERKKAERENLDAKKKSEKSFFKKKGDKGDNGQTSEDRRDQMGFAGNEEFAGGRAPGSYADQHRNVLPYEASVGPGARAGGGDVMAGVVGNGTWIDNKQSFVQPAPPKQERKESIGKGFGGIDHTMPFFSPAATSTVGRPGKMAPPVPPKHNSSFGDDISSRTDPPTVATERVKYRSDVDDAVVPTRSVPIVRTETRTITYEHEGFPHDCEQEEGVLVSSCSHSSSLQTVETTTYKTEKDGVLETRVEHKVVLSSTDDDFDHDSALADAIRSVTEFNPDMSVERIECVEQFENVRSK